MNPRIYVILCSVLLIAVTSTAHAQADVQPGRELRAEFLKLKTERERLMFCIELMENSTIKAGIKVISLENIFGIERKATLGRQRTNVGGKCTELVMFLLNDQASPEVMRKLMKSKIPFQRASDGWQLRVEHTSEGMVIDYSLSYVPLIRTLPE